MMSEKKIPETILVKARSLEISIEKITPIINQDAAVSYTHLRAHETLR